MENKENHEEEVKATEQNTQPIQKKAWVKPEMTVMQIVFAPGGNVDFVGRGS